MNPPATSFELPSQIKYVVELAGALRAAEQRIHELQTEQFLVSTDPNPSGKLPNLAVDLDQNSSLSSRCAELKRQLSSAHNATHMSVLGSAALKKQCAALEKRIQHQEKAMSRLQTLLQENAALKISNAALTKESSQLKGSNDALRGKNIQLEKELHKFATSNAEAQDGRPWTDRIPSRRRETLALPLSVGVSSRVTATEEDSADGDDSEEEDDRFNNDSDSDSASVRLTTVAGSPASELETKLAAELTQESAVQRAINKSLCDAIQLLDARLEAAQYLLVETAEIKEANVKLRERCTMLAILAESQRYAAEHQSKEDDTPKRANTRIGSRDEEAMRKQRLRLTKARANAERRKKNRGSSKSECRRRQIAARYGKERERAQLRSNRSKRKMPPAEDADDAPQTSAPRHCARLAKRRRVSVTVPIPRRTGGFR
ncbi:hypothetical protein C8R46DRAFT_242689 [Mycena filopes]|nr:hypothetical protein C8R46DRAFT_242689 [Mycena filopes]